MVLTLNQWANVATITGAAIAVGVLSYTAIQVHRNTKVNRATFWLDVRRLFSEHRDTHLKLRNLEWAKAPPTEDDWAKLEAYMGLFEHCQMMLEGGLLDWKTFKVIYGYRIQNILDEPIIVREKLIDRRKGWEVFILLLQRMKDRIPKRRYLSAYWDIDTNKWKLWWGFPELEEWRMRFNSFDDLNRNYELKFDELKRREYGLAYAWLMNKTEVLSQWTSLQIIATEVPKTKRAT